MQTGTPEPFRNSAAFLTQPGFTQTEAKLKREGIVGEEKAITAHFVVGKKVRSAIQEIQGTMPEKLPAVPSIKKVAEKQIKDAKELLPE